MTKWKSSYLFFQATLIAALVFPTVVLGQGWGQPQQQNQFPQNQQNQFPQNQQTSTLPQYEQQGAPVQQPYEQPTAAQPVAPQNNPWWQGQNAFQKPPGHPGVEQLAPTQPVNNFNPNQPPKQNYNPYGTGSPAAVNRPVPQQPSPNRNPSPPIPPAQPSEYPEYAPPVPQEPSPSGFAPEAQQPQFNNPAPSPPYTNPSPSQFNPQGGGAGGGYGWNPPQQQYQQQSSGGPGPSIDPSPECLLVNQADCHKLPNIPRPQTNPSNIPPPPQIPPIEPTPQGNNPFTPPPDSEPSQSYQNPLGPRPNSPYDPQPAPPAPQPPREPYTPPQGPRPRPQPQPQQPRPNPNPIQPSIQDPTHPEAPAVPYPGCPAAMLCVGDDFCNAIGVIEENPLRLSAAEKLYRVALVQCSEPMTGTVGVCCRDPNYVDPWPDMQGGMKKDHHHHPNKGGKPTSFKPQQFPSGNQVASGGGFKNPYSGQGGEGESGGKESSNSGWTRNRNNVQCNNLGGAGGYN